MDAAIKDGKHWVSTADDKGMRAVALYSAVCLSSPLHLTNVELARRHVRQGRAPFDSGDADGDDGRR